MTDLRFDEEARALYGGLFNREVETLVDEHEVARIEAALRAAAAKALTDFRKFIFPHTRHMDLEAAELVGGYIAVLDKRLASLAPENLPRKEEPRV